MKEIVFSYIIVILLTSSKKNHNPESQMIERIGEKVGFPESAVYKSQGDTILYDHRDNDFNVIVYINSLESAECNKQMIECDRYMANISQNDLCVGLCFVILDADVNSITDLTKQIDFRYTILFFSDSPFKFPNKSAYQVLFIDDSNRILNVGNPMECDTIAQFYQKILNISDNELISYQIRCSYRKVMLGVIYPDKTRHARINITNLGDSISEIFRIISSCDCTQLKRMTILSIQTQPSHSTLNKDMTQR